MSWKRSLAGFRKRRLKRGLMKLGKMLAAWLIFLSGITIMPGVNEASSEVAVAEEDGVVTADNGRYTLTYDLATGIGSVSWGGRTVLQDFHANYKLKGVEQRMRSTDPGVRTAEWNPIAPDGYGSDGVKLTIRNELESGSAIVLHFSLYPGKAYFLTEMTVESPSEQTIDIMEPIAAESVDIGTGTDERIFTTPYTNNFDFGVAPVHDFGYSQNGEDWYEGQSMDWEPFNGISHWVAAVFDNTAGYGLVAGAATVMNWKSSQKLGEAAEANGPLTAFRLYNWGGSHTGETVSSDRFFVGFYDNYQLGLEEYGTVYNIGEPRLEWNGPVPMGYNTYYSHYNYATAEAMYAMVDYVAEHLKPLGYEYFNLDGGFQPEAGLDTDEGMQKFADYVHSKGLMIGGYQTPFTIYDAWLDLPIPGTAYTHRDIILVDENDEPVRTYLGTYVMDVTHPGAQVALQNAIQQYIDWGFDYLKLDFIDMGMYEGKRYDPTVNGVQAYRIGMGIIRDRVLAAGRPIFINESIAPLLPAAFAHGRRTGCDTTIGVHGYAGVERMAFNAALSWWTNGTLYEYNDPDMIIPENFAQGFWYKYGQMEGKRLATAVALGGGHWLIGDNIPFLSEDAMAILTNEDLLQLVQNGKAAKPVSMPNVYHKGERAPAVVYTGDDDGNVYVGITNWDLGQYAQFTVQFADLGLDPSEEYALTELYAGRKLGAASGQFTHELEPGGTAIIKIEAGGSGGAADPAPVNLALGKPAGASSTWSDPGYEADKLTDGARTTRWSAADGQYNDQWAEIDFGAETLVNRVVIKEHKGAYFQIANYALQYWDGERYADIAKGYTVGDHKTITFPAVKTSKLRLYMKTNYIIPSIEEIEAYYVEGADGYRIAQDASGSGYNDYSDIRAQVQRMQVFKLTESDLPKIDLYIYESYVNAVPKGPYIFEIVTLDENDEPEDVIFTASLPAYNIPGSVSPYSIYPRLKNLDTNKKYAFILKSPQSEDTPSTDNKYGFAYSDANPYPDGYERLSIDGGETWMTESDGNRDLIFTLYTQEEWSTAGGSAFASYEAEDANNVLGGNASVSACAACSGGAKVGNLYMGSSLKFVNVHAGEDGVYKLRIHYTSGDPRAVYLSVNGGEGERIEPPVTPDWDTPGMVEVRIELKQGGNELLFYDNNGYSPDIDKIEISAKPADDDEETPEEEKGYAFEAEADGNELTGNAVISPCGVCSGGAIVEGMWAGSSLTWNNVYVPADGVYKVRIRYISGDPRPVHISVNGGPNEKYELPATASWGSLGTYDVTLELVKGSNTLVFSDQNWYSPNFDKIVVIPIRQSYEAEDEGNALTGNAAVSDCAACSGGKNVGGLYQGSSLTFENIEVLEAGQYELTIHYLSGDPRSVYVSVNGAEAEKVDPPATADWSTPGAYTFEIALREGLNTITFSDGNWYAPDIDRIEISRKSAGGPGAGGGAAGDIGERVKTTNYGAIRIDEHEKGIRLIHPSYSITYNTASGYADYAWNGKAEVKGAFSAVKLDGEEIRSLDYDGHVFSADGVKALGEGDSDADRYGAGIAVTIVNEGGINAPQFKQIYYLYEDRPYFFVEAEAAGESELETNHIAPLVVETKGGIDIGSYDDNRVLVVPFDNDNWSTYQARTMNTSFNHELYESSELTALYDNTSRNGLVIGSATHDTWKTGIYWSGSNNRVDQLRVYGGFTGRNTTRDTLEHGMVRGEAIVSPRIFVGYFADYRDGLETYGEANAIVSPPLAFGEGVPRGVPVGWNSWSAYASDLDYEKMVDVSDYFAEKLQDNHFNNNGTIYINMDSYWDNLTDQQIRDVVARIHANGQKAGIYWGPFVYWGSNMNQIADGTDNEYTYGDLVLRDKDGNPLPTLDGAYALDPTHPGTKKRIKHYIERFKDYGFEFIKLDFLTHGALEGDHYDPAVQTGIQAYHHGMSYVIELLDDTMFVSASIAPLFPNQYAHSRRISCDVNGTLSLTEYQLNNLTYGWWQNGTIYHYTDPDYMPLKKGGSFHAAQTRVNAVAISGTLFLSSDDVRDPEAQALMEALLTNPRVNEIALKGKAFRPVEGNTGTKASDVFVLAEDDGYYLAVFNYTEAAAEKTVSLARAGIDADKVRVTDVWTNETFEAEGALEAALEPAQSKLYRIEPIASQPGGPGPGGSNGPGDSNGSGSGDGGADDGGEDGVGTDAEAPRIPAGIADEAGSVVDLSRAITRTVSGGIVQAVLDPAEAEKLLAAAAESGADDGTPLIAIQVPVADGEDGVSLTIHKETLERIAEQGEAARLLLLTDIGNVSVPLHVLPADAEQIEVVIRQAKGGGAERQVQPPDGFRFVRAASFEIRYTDSGGQTRTIDSFGGHYFNRSIEIREAKSPGAVFAARLDKDGRWVPVPTRMVRQEDGSWHAVIIHNGSGEYTLLESDGITFRDVQGHWGRDVVEKLASRLLVRGKAPDVFDPKGQVTRAEAAALIVRALGADTVNRTAEFSDIAEDAWHARDIATAAAMQLTNGYADGSFRPDAPITREELAVMLARAAAYVNRQTAASPAAFDPRDLDAVAPWARDAVRQGIAAGILQGDDSGRIRPGDSATRAEAAAMLYRFMKAIGFID